MKKRLKEMEEEAAALREMQAKVEKEMGSVQGDDCWILHLQIYIPVCHVFCSDVFPLIILMVQGVVFR